MPADHLTVLLVEDNPGDAGLFRHALREGYGSGVDLIHCTSLEAALNSLVSQQPDVIVVDLGLPDAFGIEVVKRCHAAAPATPLVVSTARDDEALGVQALQAGAQDYLIKGEADARSLGRALRYAIERQRMRTALQSASMLDELTKLYNRKGFFALADKCINTAERTRQPLALAFIDLDGLKQINDTLGHALGDEALVETAQLLGRCIRQSDLLARFGGDEFVILLSCAGQDAEALIKDRLNAQLLQWNSQPGRRYRMALSAGVVTGIPAEGLSLDTLLIRADKRMYEQKRLKEAHGGALARQVIVDPERCVDEVVE